LLHLLGQPLGLPLVQQDACERRGQQDGGIDVPEVGDLENAIDEVI
jgi:hypothetical protein